jgi:hypothetical protein
MAVDRSKLIRLRNDIQRYLEKHDANTKLANIDTTIAEQTSGAVRQAFSELEQRFEAAYSASTRSNNSEELSELFEEMGEKLADAYKTTAPRDRTDDVVKAISEIRFPEINFPNVISVDNFPPQKIPNPVTNININGLRGIVKSVALTVTDTATKLPTTNLAKRRSLIVWNNDTTNILWIGGSDVTVANGVPVKAQNYSPAFDLADVANLYGICSTGQTVEVRILESSMDL